MLHKVAENQITADGINALVDVGCQLELVE
jgi:hypothetical protein